MANRKLANLGNLGNLGKKAELKKVGELCLMASNIDTTFEGKLTCAFKNDMKNVANFHQSMFESLKIETLMDFFSESRKCMSLKFTGEFCVMTMKNDAKFEEELTCQLKIDLRNLTKFDPNAKKFQNFAL